MTFRSLLLLSLLLLPWACAPALAFSGEDILKGNPWHHERISWDAARACGFEEAAAANVAWHADYVDSYLYNPLWWLQGGHNRFKVSLATGPELEKLHFDDHVSSDLVRATWRRYLTGTVAGLIWAWQQNDVAAARNIVGASLHAQQDFYAHSNWVDMPERRTRTWFQTPADQKLREVMYTGVYELPVQLGVKPHGKIAPAASVLNQPGIKQLMELGTSGVGLLNNTAIGQQYLASKQGVAVQPSVAGFRIPDNAVYMAPAGIALDNYWTAEIAYRQRDIPDRQNINAKQLFESARELGKQHSIQFLNALEAVMAQVGAGEFWQRVKRDPATPREHQFETYSLFPYFFITAGPWPPASGAVTDEYYLRVRIRTGRDLGAGTDSDIYLHADGKAYLLDYMPRANPVIAYNDFEAGDDTMYMVGPFGRVPPSITLENRSANAGEVLTALGKGFVSALETVVSGVGSILLSLIGGHADIVGTQRKIWSPAELAAIPASGQAFDLYVNGRDEGKHHVRCTIRKTGESLQAGWREFRVTLDRLECEAESKWDRGSNSDEPFVLALQVPLPGDVRSYRTQPFNDVDAGENRNIGYSFPTVRIPVGYGMLSIAVTVMESDDESNAARDQLLTQFANRAEQETDASRRGFTTALGASIAADWKLAGLEIYAFRRGTGVSSGMVLDSREERWVKGGSRVTYPLNAGAVRDWGITAAELQGDVSLVMPVLPAGIILNNPLGGKPPKPGKPPSPGKGDGLAR